jgi:hypothetical protein
MASYPSSIYSVTNPAGSDAVSVVDHAAQHSGANGEIIAIQTTLGTNGGTSVLKNFTAGVFAARTVNETFTTPTIQGGTISALVGGTVSTLTGGTANNLTLGTPVIGTVGVAGTVVPLSFGAAIAPTVVIVADPGSSGTATINAQSGQIFSIVFGTSPGTRTMGTPKNPTLGQSIQYRIKTSGSANGTLDFVDAHRFSGGTAGKPTIAGTSTWNYYSFRYNEIDSKWDYLGEYSGLS